MTCASSEQQFAAFHDGTLGPARRAALLDHVHGCGRCTGVMREMLALDALLAAPIAAELPDDFAARTMAGLADVPQPQRVAPRRRSLLAYLVSYLTGSWLLIAAAFVLDGAALRIGIAAAMTVALIVLTPFRTLTAAAMHLLDDAGAPVSAAIGVEFVLALVVTVLLVVLHPRLLARLRS